MDFLVIDDDKVFREATCFLIEEEGCRSEGAAGGSEALARLRDGRFDAVLLDLNLGGESGLDLLSEIQQRHPELPVVIFTARGTIQVAVEAMRRGAVDFLEKPFLREQFLTVLSRVRRLGQMGRRIERLEEEIRVTRSQLAEPIFDFSSPEMKRVMEVVRRAAGTPATILLLGESGTGKSVMARAVHEHSHLADRPFVTVSCPSLSRDLLESELFGHVKGAFTGAIRDRWGKVKEAEGGTLLLDEIGDLPLEIQPKLLRLLQEREYERLGENVLRTATVRIVSATNRDLKRRVAEGHFREDLYFRLNVIAVEVPPLRQRPEDVRRFAEHYLAHFASLCGRRLAGFSEAAMHRIQAYPWPGNLRELRNAIERAVILATGSSVELRDLPADLQGGAESRPVSDPASEPGPEIGGRHSLARIEEEHLRRVLGWASNLGEAAKVLGIDQATLYRKRRRLGLR